MVDKITKETRSKIMASIHSKNTKPEVDLRKALWTRGFRYKIHYGEEKIDIAFPSRKVALFVDGCFWHGCPVHAHKPKSNQAYWLPKLKKNVQRDIATNELLKIEGWIVIRFWEHELDNMDRVIKTVTDVLCIR
jgi:DNA mismatch endonuclease (patch repair protein)